MKEMIELVCFSTVMVCLVIVMNGFFRANRVELKRAKWKPYPKIKPKRHDGDDENALAARVLVSRKCGTVCIDTYVEGKGFTYDDVDAWRRIPLCYRANLKMMYRVIDVFRGRKR